MRSEAIIEYDSQSPDLNTYVIARRSFQYISFLLQAPAS